MQSATDLRTLVDGWLGTTTIVQENSEGCSVSVVITASWAVDLNKPNFMRLPQRISAAHRLAVSRSQAKLGLSDA